MTTIFVGNRSGVLFRGLELGIKFSKIYVVPGSRLETDLVNRSITFQVLPEKPLFFSELKSLDFDLFISNGCPYLLPAEIVDDSNKRFINIHPSKLPELRGFHPINGAILNGSGAGATCHIIDSGIDTGPIISNVEIPVTDDLDLELLYRLSFDAEADVFADAVKRDFLPSKKTHSGTSSFFSRTPEKMRLDFSKTAKEIKTIIRAFSIAPQGAWFQIDGTQFKVFDAEIVTNPYVTKKLRELENREIGLIYGQNMLIKVGDEILKLKQVQGDLTLLMKPHTKL